MYTDVSEKLCFVMEMTPKSDCDLIGRWLVKVAEADRFFSQMRHDAYFVNLAQLDKNMFLSLSDLQSTALEALAAPRREADSNNVVAVSVNENGDFPVAFGILVALGFFTLLTGRYQMVVPRSVTLEDVQRAVLDVLSFNDGGFLSARPELALHTMQKAEADAMVKELRAAGTLANGARLKSVEEIRSYLHRMLFESVLSPPDTKYQRGFYASVEELWRLTDSAGYDRRRVIDLQI